MTQERYRRIEGYMLECMAESAHDREHVYRVLYLALDIAETEPEAAHGRFDGLLLPGIP